MKLTPYQQKIQGAEIEVDEIQRQVNSLREGLKHDFQRGHPTGDREMDRANFYPIKKIVESVKKMADFLDYNKDEILSD